MRDQHRRYMLPLGAICTIGPFLVDMYLPTFPAIAQTFHVTDGAVQLTMVSYALATAVGQLIYGPAADMFGRKPPLFVGMAVYCLASLGCAVSVNIEMLIAMRFLQALGACGGMVISRAMVRDVFRGADAVKMLSLILLCISVSPILAPLAGSSVALFASWRWVFGVLTVLAGVVMVIAAFQLPETVSREERQSARLSSFFVAYARLARQWRFLALGSIIGFGFGVTFAYISGASLLFIQVYRISPTLFSMIFAANAIGLIGTAQFASRLVRRFGAARVILTGCAITAAVQAPLAVMTHFGPPPLALLCAMMFLGFAPLGLISGPTTMLAMETQHQGLGAAAALLGTMQFIIGALASSAVSLLAGPGETGMFVVMSCSSLLALAVACLVFRRQPAGSPAPIRP